MNKVISDLLVARWQISVITTALQLKIFTILANSSKGIQEISSCCGAVPHLLKPLLDACVSMGLLISNGEEYSNSHISLVHLVEDASFYAGDFFLLLHDESQQWEKLYEIITDSDNSGNDRKMEDKQRTFIKGMNNLGMLGEAEALSAAVDLTGRQLMIDAGGGSGLYSVKLCQKYPQMQSTLLDKAETLVVTREMISKFKVKEHIKLRECDITRDPLGENIDIVLLSDVIYDAEEAEHILRNAYKCLINNGLLIIRGYYSDPENTKPLFGALFVLNQLVFDPDRKILTITSILNKIKEVGFQITKSAPLTERSFIIVAEKK